MQKSLNDYVKHNYFLLLFIVCEATRFDLFTRSSSGLLTLRVEDAIYDSYINVHHFYLYN